MSKRQIVHLLTEARTADPVVLGGKGRGLAEMAALGLPVPPGFVITTTVSRAFGSHGRFPKRMQWHLDRGMQSLQRASGKRFGDPANPLLVSVRSGAPVSMPGMMDTILNLGMTDDIDDGLARQYGDEFAADCRSRFIAMFTGVTQPDAQIRLIPQDPAEQLAMAIEAVVRSWQSPRAVAYRKANNIPDWHGTAVVVQEMVFGNLDELSCTGVVFSRNITTGQPGLYGEFMVQAQGEDVVSGRNTGRPILELRDWNIPVYDQLTQYVQKLEKHYEHVVDVEFTVQSGRLYLLQVRKAKMTPLATVTMAVHDVHHNVRTKEQVAGEATTELVQHSAVASFGDEASDRKLLATGIPVSPGAVVGRVVFSSAEAVSVAKSGGSVVLFRPDTTPDDLEGMLASKAIITTNGGATCHAAVVARGMNIVAVVGCASLSPDVFYEHGVVVSVDGTNGRIYGGAMPFTQSAETKEQTLFTKWVKLLRPELLRTPPAINWDSREKRNDASIMMNDIYLSDAMAAEAKNTSLAVDAAKVRSDIHRETAEVFACYLIHAVWGELRHIWEKTHLYDGPIRQNLIGRLGKEFGFDQLQGRGMGDRSHAQQFAAPALQHRSVSEVAAFMDLATTAFDTLQWDDSYGGPKWGEIARTVRDYLRGTTTHTVFVDHVFDLEHNGGQLFDKHPMMGLTHEVRLRRQLQEKKNATCAGDLYRRLAVGQHGSLMTARVQDIWSRGYSIGLWTDAKPEPAPSYPVRFGSGNHFSYDPHLDPYLPH